VDDAQVMQRLQTERDAADDQSRSGRGQHTSGGRELFGERVTFEVRHREPVIRTSAGFLLTPRRALDEVITRWTTQGLDFAPEPFHVHRAEYGLVQHLSAYRLCSRAAL
jgi:hypothetical protein